MPLRELSALLAPDAKPDQHAFIRDLNKHDWIKPCQKLFVPPTRKEAVPKATVMPPDDGSACEDGSEAAPEAADVADRASVEVTLELRLTGQRGRVVVSDARVLKTVFEFSDDAGKDDLSLSLEPGPYSACLADRLKGTQAPFAGAHVGDRMRVTYPMLLVNLRYPRPAKE
ncbi:MAG: hypothetical protein JST92_03160 [Deltaproteobacteria bacterium]|nr:hypothetical protein [Deltaproteobacteria bacterium]